MRGIEDTPRLAAGLLLSFSLSACALLPDTSDSTTIEVAQVRSLPVCNSEGPQPRVTLLRDALALRAWQEARHLDLSGTGPLPPWASAYVVAEMGLQPSAGYAIAVSRQARLSQDNAVTLSATLLSPSTAPAADGGAAAATLTSPCALVALPEGAAYRSVELRDGAGKTLARTPQ